MKYLGFSFSRGYSDYIVTAYINSEQDILNLKAIILKVKWFKNCYRNQENHIQLNDSIHLLNYTIIMAILPASISVMDQLARNRQVP